MKLFLFLCAVALVYRVWWLGNRLAMVEHWASVNADRLLELKRRVDAAFGRNEPSEKDP